MKKRILSLLCSAALMLSLLVLPSSASDSLFFLSLNDTLPTQSAQTTPIQYNGWVYVPVTVFNSQITGISFGVYYGITDDNNSLIFYNLTGKTLTFDLQTGTASAVGGDAPTPGAAIRKNGIYYAPAYAICRFFGLSYSHYTTEYGPLLRIKDGNAVLSDSLFLSSVASLMRGRRNGDSQTTTPSSGGHSVDPVTPSVPKDPVVMPQPIDEAPIFSLSLGLQVEEGTQITKALDALEEVNASAVVFFPVESLSSQTDAIRQAAGRGHKVGLIPAGETAQARLESAAQGSQLLARILRQETWFVLSTDQALAQAGYLCWTPGFTAPVSSSATKLYTGIVEASAGRSAGQRVLLNSQTAGGILTGVLKQLAQDGDTFQRPRETQY